MYVILRGPNHAADFILTRWLRDQVNGQKILNQDTKKPILQFVGIQRRNGNEWAIPGVSPLILFKDLFYCLYYVIGYG
jgi:ADP-ribose pyrophosphatase